MNEILTAYQTNLLACTPISHKGVTVYPYKIKDEHESLVIAYSLLGDQAMFDDRELASLERLDFLISVFERTCCLLYYLSLGMPAYKQQFIEYSKLVYTPTLYEKIKNYRPNENDLYQLPKYLNLIYSITMMVKLSFHTSQFSFIDPKNPQRRVLNILQDDREKIISMSDFNEIRYIILELNGFDYSVEKYPRSIRKKLEEDLKEQNKTSKTRPPSLERLVDLVYLKKSNADYESILEMPRRKFYNFIRNYFDEQEFLLVKASELSGMREVKSPIQNWCAGDYSNDLYAEMLLQNSNGRFSMLNFK